MLGLAGQLPHQAEVGGHRIGVDPAQLGPLELLPGQSASASFGNNVSGTLLDTTITPFSSSAAMLDGSLVSTVYSGDVYNPYSAAGGLTFSYMFSLSPTSLGSASAFGVSSFFSFNTYLTKFGTGVLPHVFSRSQESGTLLGRSPGPSGVK